MRQGGRGGPQYKYFGAARNLPGVKELFEKPKAQKKARREGGSSADTHLPDEKATEKSSAEAKKSDLMAKYASEELQQQVQYQ